MVEPLSHLDGAARTVLPAKGEAGNPLSWVGMFLAGLFRLLAVALGTGLVHAVAGEPRPDGTRTRIRAAVALALTVVTIAAHLLLR